MKITKSGHKRVKLLIEKMIKEKLIKKSYNYIVWLRKQQKLINQISNFEE